MTMTHYGVDIASFQHPNGAQIGWPALYTYLYGLGGCQPFVIVKITESDNYANPFALQDIQNAVAAGFAVAIYHFVHGDVSASSQAAWIIAHLDGVSYVFLDCETENGVGSAAYVALINQIVALVQNAGEKSGVYTFANFLGWLESSGYNQSLPLWFADPSNTDPSQVRLITQTGQGNVPGISGAVDLDQASDVGFSIVFGGTVAPPTPSPIPSPTPTPTPAPSPTTPPISITTTFISISLDSNGSGAMILDGGANTIQGIPSSSANVPFANFIAATAQGSDPVADKTYWMTVCHVQNRNGFVLVTVTSGIANGQAGVFISSIAT